MDSENTQKYLDNGDDEKTLVHHPDNAPKKRKGFTATHAAVTAGAVGSVGVAAAASFLNDEHEDVNREATSEDIAQNNEINSEQPHETLTPQNSQPQAESSSNPHVANNHHNSNHNEPEVAVHEAQNDDADIEILGVFHDDEDNINIAQLSVDNQEVYLIDVDSDEQFDFLMYDENGDGDFSAEEITDISASNISVSDLGGFSHGQHSAVAESYVQPTSEISEEIQNQDQPEIEINSFDSQIDNSSDDISTDDISDFL